MIWSYFTEVGTTLLSKSKHIQQEASSLLLFVDHTWRYWPERTTRVLRSHSHHHHHHHSMDLGVHNPCHLGMGILYQSRRARNVILNSSHLCQLSYPKVKKICHQWQPLLQVIPTFLIWEWNYIIKNTSHVELCEILGFRGVWCVHNPCHLGMGILYQSRRASNVVTTHVKYGDQGITIHGWIINIIIKGSRMADSVS